jgi:hypothetical protein
MVFSSLPWANLASKWAGLKAGQEASRERDWSGSSPILRGETIGRLPADDTDGGGANKALARYALLFCVEQ